jgi:hypothetical protein
MVFATDAEAFTPGNDVASLAAGGTQPTQPVAGAPTAGTSTSTVAAPTTQASSGGTLGPAAISPQMSTPGPPATDVANGARAVAQHAADGVSEFQGASPAAASPPVIISGPAPPPSGASGAVATAQVPTSTAPTVDATAAAIMLERERRAEAITTAWPAATAREQPQAAALATELRSVISQFESLARDTPAGIAAPASPELARARARVQALVSVILSPSPLPDAAAGPRSTLTGARADASTTVAPAEPSVLGVSPARSDRFGAARHGSSGTPAESAAAPTGVGSQTSLAGGALGGGATGLTAPAALLVVAAACLLATRSRGRLSMDPLPWKSALLSSRLERPG